MSALSLQIAPKIYSLRKQPIAEVDIEKTTEVGTISSLAKSKKVKVEPKIPNLEDISIVKSSSNKSKKVKVEPEMPQSVVTVPDSEDVSIVKSSANKSMKVKIEPEMPQSVVTVTSSSVRSKKCKAPAVVNDENQSIPPKVAHVDENAAIVVGQRKDKNGTKNIRQIKQTRKSVLVPKQITPGSDDEALDADDVDFQRRQAEAVAKLKLQQQQEQKQTQKEKLELMIKQEEQKQKAANRKSTKTKGSKSELQKQKQQSHSEWFDPKQYDTKWVRHPPVVKKLLPADAEIYCRKCHEVFDDVSQLSAHEKTCYVGRHYKCTYDGCSHVNTQKSLLHQHIKAIHFCDPFICEICAETFVYKKSLDKHLKRVHKVGPQTYKYVCPECGKGTDDRMEFGIHLDRHENLKRYRCNVCGQAFYSQSHLTSHLKNSCVSSVNTSSSFECSVCGQHYTTEDRYREHFRSEHINTENLKPFFCED